MTTRNDQDGATEDQPNVASLPSRPHKQRVVPGTAGVAPALRRVRWGGLAVLVALISGCVVRETERPRGGCRGGVFVEGHRGPRGRWHEGHWRCPGAVEVVEID